MLTTLIALVVMTHPGTRASLLQVPGKQEARIDPITAALDRVRATKAESRWRLLPWMHSLSKALARARKEGKPVFYFGYDGTLDDGNS